MENSGNLGNQQSEPKKKWEGPVYLTPEDLSQMLQVSRVFIYKLVREKRIPFYHLERCVRFSPGEIEEWLREKKDRELRMPRKLKRLPDDDSSDNN